MRSLKLSKHPTMKDTAYEILSVSPIGEYFEVYTRVYVLNAARTDYFAILDPKTKDDIWRFIWTKDPTKEFVLV